MHTDRPCGSDGEDERRTWRPEANGRARVGLGFGGGGCGGGDRRGGGSGRTRGMGDGRCGGPTHWARRAGAEG